MAEDTSRPSGANKYSVYAQRSVDSTQMDWNAASKELVTGLNIIQADRVARKAAIEKSTQDAIEQLSKVPETGTQDAASLLINASAMSVKEIQEQNNLMKRGLISVQDNMLFMQQQKTGYSSLNTAVKGWDDWAVQARERLQAAKDGGVTGSELEAFTNLSVEALGNLKNKKLWSNPTNGKMQLVTMGRNTKTGLYDVMPDYEKRKQDYQNPNQIINFMKFQQDRVDVDDMATAQTSQIADIIKAAVDQANQYSVLSGGGQVTSVEDFRNLGDFGKDLNGNPLTYDMWKNAQIDAMVGAPGESNNMNAAQVLANSGGFFFAETVSQFKEEHPNKSTDFMIKVDMSSGQPIPEMNDTQITQARRLADIAVESQVNHIEKMSQGFSGQQAQQASSNTTNNNNIADQRKGYFNDVNDIITITGQDATMVAEDRIMDMNQQFLNSQNATDRATKIVSIDRTGPTIIITKEINGRTVTETIDKFGKDANGQIDTTKPLETEIIAKKLYREILPRDVTKDMSFDQMVDSDPANKWTTRFLPNGQVNPDWKGDEEFGTTRNYKSLNNYNSDNAFTDGSMTTTMNSEFAAIPDERNNYLKAAPVVKKAFSKGLEKLERNLGSSIGLTVSTFNASGSTNDIIVKYKDPVTNQNITKTFGYDADNSKLQGEVDAEINRIIDAYNTSKAGTTNTGGLPPSDIRLKENISLIGKSNNGINIYSWNYKQGVYDQGTYTGVMAQEVPWATVKVGDYLHVDYTKVDVEFNKIA